MYATIKVERNSEDGLEARVWKFMLFETTLVLDTYTHYKKESKKQKKCTITEEYQRVGIYGFCGQKLTEEEAPLPIDVIQEAIHKLVCSIKVTKWTEYKS